MSHSATHLATPGRVGLLLLCTILTQSTATAQSSGWTGSSFLNVNGGYQPSDQAISEGWETTLYDETASFSTARSVGRGGVFDVNGGVGVWRSLAVGVGVSVLNTSRNATVDGTVPSPLFYYRPRTAPTKTLGSTLEHRQVGIHVMAIYVFPMSETIDIAVFGGPSIFAVRQDLVNGATLESEQSPFFDIAIDNVTTTSTKKTGVGGNVGVDVTVMLTDMIGLGGLVRYARASVDLGPGVNPQSIDVGGLQVGGGLRLRFPSFF